MTLSDKEFLCYECEGGFKKEDVKQFIRDLKKEIIGKQGILEDDYNEIITEIDKLAGKELKEKKG